MAKLAPQYYRPDFGTAQAEALFEAFFEDLQEFSVREIEEAIVKYRRDTSQKFFPTSGQIRALTIEISGRSVRYRPSMNAHKVIPKDPRPNLWWFKSVWYPHWKEIDIPIEEIRGYELHKQRVGEPKRLP